MTSNATSTLIRLFDEHHSLEDYQGGVPRWCTGCGDNAILTAVQRLCRDEEVDLLIVGWGSTKGAIEEAVERLRREGRKVSSLHLTFLQPMPSGIGEILRRFKRVMTIENNWSDRLGDDIIDHDNRRYSALAWMLRARYLVDVDCWSESRGRPIKPSAICSEARGRLEKIGGTQA